ncbi:MAG: polysaccharide biosynthesis protein, partial [Pseudomonadota bacterium]|nr:polysaccharide biosynthesis protein [Pseudomonadota bacterium]
LSLTLLGVIHFGLAGVVFAPLVTWALVYPILIWTIRRFDGWDPVHDAIYAFFTFALSGALLVYHWETVRPLLTPLLD